jgi:hypothetical protein
MKTAFTEKVLDSIKLEMGAAVVFSDYGDKSSSSLATRRFLRIIKCYCSLLKTRGVSEKTPQTGIKNKQLQD